MHNVILLIQSMSITKVDCHKFMPIKIYTSLILMKTPQTKAMTCIQTLHRSPTAPLSSHPSHTPSHGQPPPHWSLLADGGITLSAKCENYSLCFLSFTLSSVFFQETYSEYLLAYSEIQKAFCWPISTLQKSFKSCNVFNEV